MYCNNFEEINEALQNEWGCKDLRHYKYSLTVAAQQAVKNFSPIIEKSHEQNPIQLIDFFCGAGGTSLGFEALNSVVPAFNILGGCDTEINFQE